MFYCDSLTDFVLIDVEYSIKRFAREKGSDEYISKAATTVEEVCKLVDLG